MIRIFIAAIIFLSLQVTADTLEAGIKYNEASARVEAFKDIQKKLPKDILEQYLSDPNRKENIELLKNNIYEVTNSRDLCPFYLKKTLFLYSVTYWDTPLLVFYYNPLGSLSKMDVIEKTTFPRRTIGYSRKGNLVSVAFEIDEQEQFIYDEKGKLIAHWQGSVMTDKNNLVPKFIKVTRGESQE